MPEASSGGVKIVALAVRKDQRSIETLNAVNQVMEREGKLERGVGNGVVTVRRLPPAATTRCDCSALLRSAGLPFYFDLTSSQLDEITREAVGQALQGFADGALDALFRDYDPAACCIEAWTQTKWTRVALVLAAACVSDSCDIIHGVVDGVQAYETLGVLCSYPLPDTVVRRSEPDPTNPGRAPTVMHIAALSRNAAPFRSLLRLLFSADERNREENKSFFESIMYSALALQIGANLNVMKCLIATGQADLLAMIIEAANKFHGSLDNARIVEMLKDNMLRSAVECDDASVLSVLYPHPMVLPERAQVLLKKLLEHHDVTADEQFRSRFPS